MAFNLSTLLTKLDKEVEKLETGDIEDHSKIKTIIIEMDQKMKELHSTFVSDIKEWRSGGIEEIPKPVQSNELKIGRNEPCPCGSGKKFKHCCLM